MPACVPTDGGECSEWFEVKQGLRQEWVLSRLRFNVFFGGCAIHIVLVRFSEDEGIITSLIHLAKDGADGETA